jgi:hypothetical protein
MSPEARLDRLERIAKLFVSAGLRARRNMRELDEKFGILVDAQIQTEQRFVALAESQTRTDEKLNTLIDIFRRGNNGKA